MKKSEILTQLINLIYTIPIIILAFWKQLGLTIEDAFFILIGSAVAISLFRISGSLEKGIIVKVRSSHSNPNKNEEEGEVRTSGGGAFAGMLAGGALGLLFGPAGVVIGGLLGAAAGNHLEYIQEKERRKKEKRRKK